MLALGKMNENARELIKFKYDLAAIQEIRWKGQGENDLRKLKVRGWREAAKDRERWKKVVTQAKTHPEL